MRKLILLVVFIASLFITNMTWAAPTKIAVAIELDKLAVQLRGQSDYTVLDMDTNALLYDSKGKKNAFLNVKDDVLYINNDKLPDKVKLVPSDENFIEINRRVYRGYFNVYKTKNNTIEIVNVLPLEEYLASALSKEIENGFNEQVIKAQAVVMRSQAYFLAGSSNSNYDLIANDLERGGVVYLGKDAESKEALKAVQETAGEVMLHNGQPIFAMWHISSGGYTENGQEFFENKLPYLRTVKDLDDNSKFYRWKYDFAPADLDAAFERAGYKLGKIELIKLSPLPKTRPDSNHAADRSSVGRLKEVTVVGDQGQKVVLPAQKFVSILGLNSSLFDVLIGTPLPKDIIATITDPFGNEQEINRIEVNISEHAGYRLPGDDVSTHRISRVKEDKIVFYGYGTGHGFGLSQQGAQAMAEKDLKAKIENIKALEQKQKTAEAAKKQAADKSKDPKPAAEKSQKTEDKVKVKDKDKVKDKQPAKVETKQPTKNNKPEPVTLDKGYYKKILAYYFTDVNIKKVY